MNKKRGAKNSGDFKNSSVFYEELLMMRSQFLITELLEKTDTRQDELARRLELSQAAVSRLLDTDRNLTLRSFAKICFALGHEVQPVANPIATKTLSDCFLEASTSYQSFGQPAVELSIVEEEPRAA